MAVTILMRDASRTSERGEVDGDDLWVPVDELEAATGWELKPEGICREEVCIPVYGQAEELVADRGGVQSVNFAGFARYLSQPYAHDDEQSVWYFGESSQQQRTWLQFLDAPDFELPDFEGNTHRLSDYRGKKVALALWASW